MDEVRGKRRVLSGTYVMTSVKGVGGDIRLLLPYPLTLRLGRGEGKKG